MDVQPKLYDKGHAQFAVINLYSWAHMILSITNCEQVIPIESTQPPETFSQVRTQSVPMGE